MPIMPRIVAEKKIILNIYSPFNTAPSSKCSDKRKYKRMELNIPMKETSELCIYIELATEQTEKNRIRQAGKWSEVKRVNFL